MAMSQRSVLSLGPHGFHKIAYTQWGSAHNEKTLICVHGMIRTGRDFDFIAEALQDHYRVVCPDLPGRGLSHWLKVAADYHLPTYLTDMAAQIARLGVEQVDWIGTSLGGLIGIMLAAQPNTPIRKLVLNDIGPFVPKQALERINNYVSMYPSFATLDELESYMREIYKPFGALPDEHWKHLAKYSSRQDVETGTWRMHYDPGIAEPHAEGIPGDIDLWPVWDAVSCPVLLLRGAESDVLSTETAREMLTRGPETELIEFDGIGHAPMLMDPAQINRVRDWLLS